jgi:hypothetical protein
MGLIRCLRLEEFTRHNTDGPANPNALATTAAGSKRTSPLSGSRVPTGGSCTRRLCRYTGSLAKLY